jgi:uncharacterized protein
VPAAPRRTCVGCREQRDKRDLIRIARTPDGVRIDPEQRFPGRGAYVCPTPTCVAAAAHRGGQRVRQALRGAPDDEVRAAVEALTDAIRHHEPTNGHPPAAVTSAVRDANEEQNA